MKQMFCTVFIIVFLAFFTGTAAHAKTVRTTSASSDLSGFEIDGSFGFATGPDHFDTGYGLNFGAGYMLGTIDKNLQARVDLSYFDFSYTYGYGYNYDLSYTRAPLTVSARYYFPIVNRLKAFAQAGLETSIDQFDYVDGAGRKQSKSEINLGVSPGGGVEFFINRDISVFAVGRWHIIDHSYFSGMFGAAYHF